MIWLIILVILAPILYVAGFILDRGSPPKSKPEKWGNFLRFLSYVLFAVILIILLIGAGFALVHTKAPPLAREPFVHEVQAFILPISQATYLPTRNYDVPDPDIQARAATVIDVRSGRILYSKNADRRLPIASITKLMTALVVLDRLDLDGIYTVSAEDLNLDGLGADFAKGEQLTGRDLLKIMLIKSSNDATSVFNSAAQSRGMDLIGFMNMKARQLGMYDTHFGDPAGLDDGATYSTAQDLVQLLAAVRKSTELTRILAEKSVDVASIDRRYNHHVITTNQLLGKIPGIIIGKTGNTAGALGTMTLVVKVGDGSNELIVVVLGSNDRFGETAKLVDWAQQAYKWQ